MPVKSNESSRVKVTCCEGAQGPLEAIKKPVKTGSCPPAAHAGTGLANLDIPIGCASSPRIIGIASHGGARNTASRTSGYLTPIKALYLIEAAHRARKLGRPLNRHITVHWEAAGVPDSMAMAATTAFLKAYRDWLGGETGYLWVRENGVGKGSHVHIVAHLPTGRRWHGMRARRWIERITNEAYRAGTIQTRQIAGAGDPQGHLYAANLNTVLAYVLKGVEPHVAEQLGIAHQSGGSVIGKRCGTSRNIVFGSDNARACSYIGRLSD